MEWLWWLAGAVVLGVIEVLTLDLTFAMLAAGGLAATIASGLGAPWWVSAIVFAVVSVLMLGAIRPSLLRVLKLRRQGAPDVGVEAHVGKVATVLAEVTSGDGRVKLDGDVWSARAAKPGLIVPPGAEVVVERIDGATAIVDLAPGRW